MESRNITILDIASKANVSKSTVSRVLNNSSPVNEAKRHAVLAALESLTPKQAPASYRRRRSRRRSRRCQFGYCRCHRP